MEVIHWDVLQTWESELQTLKYIFQSIDAMMHDSCFKADYSEYTGWNISSEENMTQSYYIYTSCKTTNIKGKNNLFYQTVLMA